MSRRGLAATRRREDSVRCREASARSREAITGFATTAVRLGRAVHRSSASAGASGQFAAALTSALVLTAALPATLRAQARPATPAGAAAAERTTSLAAPARDSVLAEFSRRLAADVATDDVGSIAAAVVIGDSVVWARAFGWADRERGLHATPHTIYRTGSISKSFTAVAMMQLVERGVIGLDDPVARHLPAVREFADRPDGAPPITFRQLASHTAGLDREPELDGAAAGPIEGWEHRVLASIPATAFESTPGTRYSYSNIGFGTLGLAISRAAGRPFTVLVREGIIEPLGMTSTTFVITPELAPRLAKGYVNRRDGTIDARRPAVEHRGRGYKVPNGGVYSTVHDLARFIAALTGEAEPAILTPVSRAEMQRDQTPATDEAMYGLGFSIRDTDVGRMIGHGGSVAGYNAYILWHPDTRTGAALLRNYSRGSAGMGEYASELLRALLARAAT